MNLDKHLITGLLHSEDRGATESLRQIQAIGHEFAGDNRIIFKFIEEHVGSYEKAPARSTIEEKYPNFDLTENAEPFAFYVSEALVNRRKLHIQESIAKIEDGLSKGKLEEAISDYITSVQDFETEDPGSQDTQLRDGIDGVMDEYKHKRDTEDVRGLPTGFETLDEATFGIQPSELWLLGGRNGTYKTWLTCKMATGSACGHLEKPVLFFSKEMTKIQIQQRIMAIMGQIAFKQVRRYQLSDAQIEDIKQIMLRQFTSEFIIIGRDRQRNYDISYIHSKILEYGPSIAYIDGFYLLVTDDQDWKQHTALTRRTRDIGLATNVPIFGTVQYEKKGKSIAYSDSYHQDASVILKVEREFDTILEKKTNTVKLTAEKIRDEDDDISLSITLDFKNSTFNDGEIHDSVGSSNESNWQDEYTKK